MSQYSYEVFLGEKKKGKRTQTYFRIVHPNGNTLCTSEGYNNTNDCLDTVAGIIGNNSRAKVVLMDGLGKQRPAGES